MRRLSVGRPRGLRQTTRTQIRLNVGTSGTDAEILLQQGRVVNLIKIEVI